MMQQQHNPLTGQHTRRDASARVRGAAFVAATHVGVAAMLVITAKINPSWVSGGLPREGSS